MITRKTKTRAVTAVLFFLAVATVTFFIWNYVNTSGEQLQLESREVANYKAREKTYGELEASLEASQENRHRLVNNLLTEEDTIDFLALIESIAVEQDIELVTDSLKVVPGDTLFDTLIIAFSVTGMESQVIKMLQILETLPYHSQVSKVHFTNTALEKKEVVQGTIELEVTLLQYDR